jgi:hypothetical protein
MIGENLIVCQSVMYCIARRPLFLDLDIVTRFVLDSPGNIDMLVLKNVKFLFIDLSSGRTLVPSVNACIALLIRPLRLWMYLDFVRDFMFCFFFFDEYLMLFSIASFDYSLRCVVRGHGGCAVFRGVHVSPGRPATTRRLTNHILGILLVYLAAFYGRVNSWSCVRYPAVF